MDRLHGFEHQIVMRENKGDNEPGQEDPVRRVGKKFSGELSIPHGPPDEESDQEIGRQESRCRLAPRNTQLDKQHLVFGKKVEQKNVVEEMKSKEAEERRGKHKRDGFVF